MTLFDKSDRTTPASASPMVAADGSVSAFRPRTDTSALRALQTIIEPGTTIDHFQVGKLLGRGSMAAVYDGTDINTKQPVALKVLDIRYSADPEMVRRFLDEGDALARFNHPNIVTHVAHGSDETFSYIAMEMVQGITLDQLIHTIEFEPRHILHLAREISKGLTTIHAAGILHGDVKPSNILVTRAGQVKISDFGTAVQARISRIGKTRISGTAPYMAPELFDSAQEVDYRADIFSLGVTFYKILTGKLPGDPLIPATTLNPELPADVDAVLQKALHHTPESRFITAKEFCDALAALFDGEASVTPVSGPGELAHKRPDSPADLKAAKAKAPGIDWKMVLLCGLAAIGLAATLIFAAVYFGRW